MANVYENAIDVLEVDSDVGIYSKEKIINEFAKITQFITWPILFILFKLFFNIRIEGQEIFREIKSPFMIIANHTSFYDSFLFRLILGFSTPHLPLRFMAVTKFDSKVLNFLESIGIISFIYSLFGVFTVTPGLGITKNLEKPKQIISLGGNIVIYPEGKITKTGEVGTFKKGAAVIFKQTNVTTIPVSFNRSKKGHWRKFIGIRVGHVIEIDRNLQSDEITKIFYKIISHQHAKLVHSEL